MDPQLKDYINKQQIKFNATQNKTIIQIDDELQQLIQRAQSGQLTPEEYSNSTFTISNLGSSGIDEFTAIINPPNSAILAVGAIERQVQVVENDLMAIQSIMKLTLVCDHRVIDGAQGAAFLKELKELLSYQMDDGYLIFDKSLIMETKNTNILYNGSHMGLGEDRRKPEYRRIESTFWMLKILVNLEKNDR
jgi:hypothetical protein